MGLLGRLFGRGEKIDPRPLELPAGMMLPETAEQKIERMIRTRLSVVAAESGEESFAEANDFEMGDEDPTTLPTSHEMASEVMEEMLYEARESGQRNRRNPDGDSEERIRRKRDAEGSDRDQRSVQRDREDGEEDESGAPPSARRDERDRDARPDRRGRKDESRRTRDGGTRDGRGDE